MKEEKEEGVVILSLSDEPLGKRLEFGKVKI
jgi:hypothetical protein